MWTYSSYGDDIVANQHPARHFSLDAFAADELFQFRKARFVDEDGRVAGNLQI